MLWQGSLYDRVFLSAEVEQDLGQILTLSEAIKDWNENKFDNYSCILLTRTIATHV